MSKTTPSTRLPILPTPGLTHPRFTRLRFMTNGAGDGTPGAGGDGGGDNGEGGKEFKAPANQAEFDAMVKDRIARERAKFADYSDLKAKAQQFDVAQEASKTEAQKTADRIAKLEQELESTRTTALRARIQAKHGISDEDAAVFLTATDEATLTKQAERLAALASDRKKHGNRDPFAGRTPSNGGGTDADERAAVRSLFGSGD